MGLGDFTAQAEAYRHSRPSYPKELCEVLFSDARMKPGDPVADFGAGTGLFTRILVDQGLKVTAIEPNQSMRDRAEVKEATWINGSFEASGLESGSQKWAVAAQAFHWADPPTAMPELRRILQPDCLFTAIWNDRSRVGNDVVQMTESLIRQYVPEFDEAYRERPWNQILESTGDFQFFARRNSIHLVTMSCERYLNLWKSHNRLNTIAGPERFDRFFSALSSELNTQKCESVNVVYECHAWSAKRAR